MSLTVIVLTCNSASTIEACLESLATQEFADFKTIVVDDKSSDETVSLASKFSSRLRLSIATNGARNIPRGRNIGLQMSTTEFAAFLDSDDSATRAWTRSIMRTFDERPELAMIAGDWVYVPRNKRSRAIGVIDATVYRVAAKGVMHFSAGNCAINQRLLPGAIFDEQFEAAEDLELVERVQRKFAVEHIPEMQVNHSSRETFGRYAKQMYRYGFMKMYFSYCAKSYRWIDFAPLSLMIVSLIAGAVIGPWWISLAIIPFSLCESLFVVASVRCSVSIAVLTVPAWIVKNIAWSFGVGLGALSLAIKPDVRFRLRSKRLET